MILRLLLMTFFFSTTFLQATLQEQRYFLGHISQHMTSKSAARKEQPIAIPVHLPSATKIAHTIARRVPSSLFLRGASTSEHQCSTRCTPAICSWSRFAQEHHLPQPSDKPGMMNLWNYYRAYFDYAADVLKFNALRFSIEWALVQPEGPDSWDQDALNHYADMVIYALKKGIAPVICFHHYTDPNWFLDRGGFEKDENISYFVTYCTKVYEHIMTAVANDSEALSSLKKLSPRKPLWVTFNAPDGYAFRGYRQQQGPPADPKRAGLGIVAHVIKNTLESHVGVYYALKDAHKNLFLEKQIDEPMVGILKNIHQIDPATKTLLQRAAAPITKAMAAIADMIQNGSFYSFFTKGDFSVYVPVAVTIHHKNEKAIGALDFLGLNYYSNRYLYLNKTVAPTDPDLMTDNGIYYRYPAGMYRAIVELHEKIIQPYHKMGKNIPLIVAENGIATTDDAKRSRFYHEYLYAIAKAVKDGYPVYGYLPWTFATNYEWPSIENNTERDYGLCAVDKDNKSQLIAKKGSQPYLTFVKTMARLK